MELNNPSDECMEEIYKKFGTTKTQLKEDVQIVKKWLQQQPHLPNVDDEAMLENMLVRCKCSVERAKQTWDMHFTIKTALPEVFANRDPLDPDMTRVSHFLYHAPMLNPTTDGYRVYVSKVQKDSSALNVEHLLKLVYMMADIDLKEDKTVGNVLIYDQEYASLDFLSKCTLPMMKKLDTVMKGYRFRIKGVHYINAPPSLDYLLSLMKSVMKSKLVSRIHVHPNLESLFTHVDRKLLPREYGGDGISLELRSKEYIQKMSSYREWFLEQNGVMADLPKKSGEAVLASDMFGFEGTFKKLTVD